ncbi:MAG: Protein grpE [uncultured bacterium]|nr:MAG: Protein grpE [uncultured bacterium]
MSQKKEASQSEQSDKWRDIAEQEVADDEHLLPDETASAVWLDKVNLLEKQLENYKEQSVRAQAEAENTRRRMEQEVAKARKFGVEKLVSDLIPVVDSLARGMEGAVANDPSVQQMRKGMELTLTILDKILEKNGVSVIDPKAGDVFDPMQHEAMSMQPNPDAKPNTILQLLQKGYALNGRVIRAAMVIVVA